MSCNRVLSSWFGKAVKSITLALKIGPDISRNQYTVLNGETALFVDRCSIKIGHGGLSAIYLLPIDVYHAEYII